MTLSFCLAALAMAGCSEDLPAPFDAGPGDEDAAAAAQDAGFADAAPNPDDGGDPSDSGEADAGIDTDGGTMTSTGAGIKIIELGTLTLDAAGTASVSFTLPDPVATFMVILRGPNEGSYIIRNLTGPTGELVTDDDSMVTQIERLVLGPFAAQFKSPNRVVQDEGVAAALFPNNPDVSVAAGAYSMTVFGASGQMLTPFSTDVSATILYREMESTAGLVDVNLYFSGAGNMTAASAPTDALMIGALTELRTIYAQANISIGRVTYQDIDPSYETIDSIQGVGSDLANMFEETRGKDPGLHYFFVNRFMAGPLGGGIGGISGGLPGPAFSVGTVNSGVAVSMTAAMNDPAVLAHIMAHEGGHWLGLFHTSEITGTDDQHPDTPSGQAGNMFLMFPAVGGGQQISDGQARVMRHHMEINAR